MPTNDSLSQIEEDKDDETSLIKHENVFTRVEDLMNGYEEDDECGSSWRRLPPSHTSH